MSPIGLVTRVLIEDTGQLAPGASNLLFTGSSTKRSLMYRTIQPTPCEKRGVLWQSLSTYFRAHSSGFTILLLGQPCCALWESFVSLPSAILRHDSGSRHADTTHRWVCAALET